MSRILNIMCHPAGGAGVVVGFAVGFVIAFQAGIGKSLVFVSFFAFGHYLLRLNSRHLLLPGGMRGMGKHYAVRTWETPAKNRASPLEAIKS
jgi:hypothetical protein